MALDVILSDAHDLFRPVVFEIISGCRESISISFIWLGTPCSSWSRARHDLPDSWGPRSRNHIWGKPNLSDRDKERVKIGNRTLNYSNRIIKLAKTLFIPVVIENPDSSYLWHAPTLVRLSGDSDDVIVDFCQFKKRRRKRTRLRVWLMSELTTVSRTCSGRHGVCSATGKPHIVLSGRNRNGIPWTKIAEPYPALLSKILAKTILRGIDNRELAFRMSRLCWAPWCLAVCQCSHFSHCFVYGGTCRVRIYGRALQAPMVPLSQGDLVAPSPRSFCSHCFVYGESCKLRIHGWALQVSNMAPEPNPTQPITSTPQWTVVLQVATMGMYGFR